MKRIFRMLIFSGVALYLTSLWNLGFKISYQPSTFLKTVILIAVFYYLLMPIAKLILLPVNWLTLGLLSTVIYFLLFYLFVTRFSLVEIEGWQFQGFNYYFLQLAEMKINYWSNLLLSSFSLSFIIRLLENIL